MKSVPAQLTARRSRRLKTALAALTAVAGLTSLLSCTEAPKPPAVRYATLAHKNVPDYLKDTILEYTDVGGTEPFPVSGYGLIANLNGTGGSRAPAAVHDYMIKEMQRRGFGSLGSHLGSPEDILNNKSFAIVRVDGFIPPGARAGSDWWTWFDVRVSALPENDNISLAHGDLYETDLKVGGANPQEPGSGTVAVKAQARGSIFINPAYALDGSTDTLAARASRRGGVVLGGARPLEDRPLYLRLRLPERKMARAIERRINEQFQDMMDRDLPVKGTMPYIADAQDEGLVKVLVPRAYTENWEHFVGVLKHTYMRGVSAEFAAAKSRQLAEAAARPDAPLLDISYAWEGLGKPALHALAPLMSSPDPDIQYAATRAAAFIGDPSAMPVLLTIARTPGNPFRVSAVQALGELPSSPRIDRLLAQLLDSDEATVRIHAYQVLARHKDGSIFTKVIHRGENEKFVLDIVRCGGTPMVYASRQGIPRLAIFGMSTALDMPVMFSTLNNLLSISSAPNGNEVTIFYRGPELRKPVQIFSSPDLAEIASRLGGEGAPGNSGLDFSYADVVAIMQTLIDGQKVSGLCGNQRQLASFVLQEPPQVEAAIDSAPLLRDSGRPQTAPQSNPGTGGQPVSDASAVEQRPAVAGSNAFNLNGSELK